MRKIVLFLAILCAIVLSGCGSQQSIPEATTTEPVESSPFAQADIPEEWITTYWDAFADYYSPDQYLDLCDIMRWFIENEPKYHHYNVCRGSKIDLYSLACMVRKILGIDCDIIVSEPGWKPEYTGDNTRLLEELGNYRFTGFEESISKLCEFYKDHIEEIDESKLI